jgi:uncharacterized membrane protein
LEDQPSWFDSAFLRYYPYRVGITIVPSNLSAIEPQFIYANGFMLPTVAILPFSSGLMAEYLKTDYAQTAVSIYCFGLLLHNVSWIIWGYTTMHPYSLARDANAEKQLYINTVKSPRIAFIFYLSICILSFWVPGTAMVLITASWMFWIVTSVGPALKK